MPIRLAKVEGSPARVFRDFLSVPWQVYGNGPTWVPPLLRETRFKLDRRRNPFFAHGDVRALVAYDSSGRPCGRIAAITNQAFLRVHSEPTGFFGLFECIDDHDVAVRLIDHLISEFREQGMRRVIGPVNLSTNDESGLLLEGYDQPPSFMCNYCLPYYHRLMESCGFTKAIDTLAYETNQGHPFPQKYRSVLRRVQANPRISLRRFEKKSAIRDILQIREIYNESFRGTWGFVPLSEDEAMSLGKRLLEFADLDLVWIASYDNQPVGAILGFPDINEILQKLNGRLFPLGFIKLLRGLSKVRGMRVAAFGVLPEYRARGIETLLIHPVHERINSRPYQRAEFSVVMEDNTRMRHLLESMGFRKCRRYRIYQMDLT